MSENDLVIGIDLGTTNSEVAALVDGRMQVLGPGNAKMLPSCVGFSPSGELLVGESARNQQLVYPELTVKSIKRKMGSDEKVKLGEKMFTSPEISALILCELVRWAAEQLGSPADKAVITVPAYFSDAQRQATREAGGLAGLEVVRILNEPTAASLAYGGEQGKGQTVMVYDLGGGTFDVSVVRIENEVTEVLASHGNNHLGGDDFDQLLVDRLLEAFRDQHGIDVRDQHPAAYARVWRAAEQAKKTLSYEPYATVREEGLATVDGRPLHLELELTRAEYEDMIRPSIESTLDSVSKAMDDASKQPGELDAVLLVGGSTRTPLIWQVLEERTGIQPRQDIHPDLCVALGAGVLASRLAGRAVERVLVDVSPYSFGPSHLGDMQGRAYAYCYRPIIQRNTPLPVTRTERYYTSHAYQEAVDIEIFQGDDADALKNIPVGSFRVEGLKKQEQANEVLCRMSLDLDGILRVTATEKQTGKSKYITITNSLKPKSEDELAALRSRLKTLYESRDAELDATFVADADQEEDFRESLSDDSKTQTVAGGEQSSEQEQDPGWTRQTQEAQALIERSRHLLQRVHDQDKEEMIDLNERIEQAIAGRDAAALPTAMNELNELLFFVEGK